MPTFKPHYGLQKIEVAPAVQNNTDPTTLTPIPFTKLQTAVYGNDANTTSSISVEEQVTPIAILDSEVGARTFKWNTYANSLELLAMLEGGKYTAGSGGTPDTYSPPETPTQVYLFVKFTDQQGGIVKFYNAKIEVQRIGNKQKSALPELSVTATAMSVGDGFYSIIESLPTA